jgi:RNA polymerase sigma-70 factor, ECF subfamily
MEKEAVKKRETEAKFLEGYEAYSDAIFRYVYSRIGDRERALEITQDVFLKEWKFLSEGGEIQNMRAFLYKLAGNMVIDEYRKRRPQDSLDLMNEEIGFEPSTEDDFEKTVTLLDGEKALILISKIPEPYKEALSMRFLENLTLSEMCEITGERENTLSVRIHRGLSKLEKIFNSLN